MDVSFDGLRKSLIRSHNSLVKKLNEGRGVKYDFIGVHKVEVDVDSIQRDLDELRSCIVTLAFMYQDGPDGFQELPEETHFEEFNPQE